MKGLIDYLQLGTNGVILTVLGWLYFAYVKNIKAEIKLKDEQIKVSEKNLAFWKDKAVELERKSPEFFEGVLENRIKIREKELSRLSDDTLKNKNEIEEKNRQLDKLNSELEKAKYFSRALTYYDLEIGDDVIIPESEVELVELGEIFVDSASIMITDPWYISQQWKDVEYVREDSYMDSQSGEVFKYRRDFDRFDEILMPYNKDVNQLIKDDVLVLMKEKRQLSYSYAGSAYATSTDLGFGVLPFDNGNLGAALCIRTVYGDGVYRVMGEKYKGRVIRVYIDLQ
ncbi:hypothetical protein C0558_24775 [Serratia marcescens]|uniref:hypothetical protein n=1 Tax=Serratia TaxID=613 RepID=UPI00083E770C|nr:MULTISPECIES: hypothetical protein [Serratia]AUO04830.1 hypothetical protein C0558_24775 [Serratia marcescens]MBN5208832.1 hypothetical protein [Serratia ureilytica]MBN5243659.1 hypothetical protein [Serratia ureilytica]ODJ15757.1 hypothetical protein BBC05_13620 [Serratia sp. ISTD04]